VVRVGLAVVIGLGLIPAPVSAHGVAGSRFDAPLPLSLLFVGAGATVALTALWLAITGRVTMPEKSRSTLFTVPPSVATPIRCGIGGVFLVGFFTALVLGVVGRQVAAENFSTVFTWPVLIRGVALLAILFGTPWGTASPWRTIYRGLVRLEGRSVSVLGSYPTVLGSWPALIGFVLLVGVVGTLTGVPRSPRLTTVVLAVYALVMVGGSVTYGRAWFRHGDPLEAFYRLFGRVAIVDISETEDGGYAIALSPPWQGCLDPVGSVPLVVFVIAMVYTVSFDGFTNTQLFQTVLFGGRDTLGTGSGTSVLLYAVGLAGFVATFGAVSVAVERLGSETSREWIAAARRFAPTVLPIAAAYEVAHSYPYVIRNLGQLLGISLRRIRLDIGPIDLLGWLSVPVFWGSQVVLIVLGHVIAVVAAHHVAVERYDSPAGARRGHAPLVVLMVGYTVLSLWIVSQPVVSG
jgi:hypothetical protein